jgi:hypothetical protein
MSARKLAKEVGKKHGIGLKDLDSLEDISDKGLRELLKRDSLTGKKGGGSLSNRKTGKGKPYRPRPKAKRKQKSDPHRTAFPRTISVKKGGKIMQGYKAGGKV